ncbi:MAG: YtzH-like family protein [Bacillaceae bacterium]
MPLNHQHQMTILKDILSNQKEDCCGTVAEYEQVGRLAQSLISNDNIHNQLKDTLTNVYSYSVAGKNATDVDSHISSHQDDLSQWIDNFDTYS